MSSHLLQLTLPIRPRSEVHAFNCHLIVFAPPIFQMEENVTKKDINVRIM